MHVHTHARCGRHVDVPGSADMHLLGNAAVAQVRCALANQLLSRTRHTCGRATARLRVSGERACGVDGAPQLVTSVYEPFVTVSIHVKMQQTTGTFVCSTIEEFHFQRSPAFFLYSIAVL